MEEVLFGLAGGSLVTSLVNRFVEIMTGRGVWEYVSKKIFHTVPKDVISELNHSLRIFFQYKYDLQKEARKVKILPTPASFFKHKTKLVESLGKDDIYWLMCGRPFHHLLEEELEAIQEKLSPEALNYLNVLRSRLLEGWGKFICFVDPVDTIRQIAAKGFTKNDIIKANQALIEKTKKYKNLEIYSAPVQFVGLDCISVNTKKFPNEVVFGHRPFGAHTFTMGVRANSERLSEDIVQRLSPFLNKCRAKEKKCGIQKFFDLYTELLIQ